MTKRKAPQSKGFNIVWEDEYLAVVHKGPGLLSVPDSTGAPALTDRLAELLAAREKTKMPVYPLHRLDKDVSGLLVFAKTARARDAMRDQFAEGKPERTYLAVIRGQMRDPAGTISSYLDTKSDRPRSVAADRGVPAITHYKTLAQNRQASLLEVKLETGRKNQIRVHFAEAGHPLLGDRKYGGPELGGFDRRRIALHAVKLTFEHPIDGRVIEVDDPAPAAFRRMFGEGEHRNL